jgi:hypothetical protein
LTAAYGGGAVVTSAMARMSGSVSAIEALPQPSAAPWEADVNNCFGCWRRSKVSSARPLFMSTVSLVLNRPCAWARWLPRLRCGLSLAVRRAAAVSACQGGSWLDPTLTGASDPKYLTALNVAGFANNVRRGTQMKILNDALMCHHRETTRYAIQRSLRF